MQLLVYLMGRQG